MTSSKNLPKNAIHIISFIAIILSIFQIYQGLTAQVDQNIFRPIHLGFVIVLVFLFNPLCKLSHTHHYDFQFILGKTIDLILILATIFATYHIAKFDYDDLSYLFDGLSQTDYLSGVLLFLLLIEATRRTVGLVMVFIALVFLSYALFGNLLPDNIASGGFSVQEIVTSQVFSTDGIFGTPLAIASSVVFIYILFGSFLQVTGAGEFFIDSAFAVAGKYRGGPAKASVIASAALGSISGSAIANTVTTGALTIPMMKKLGYRPEQAAGIEAAASTGGQIMPPVMGAGAFVMAQFTGISYSTILLVSIIPAILYFSCTLLYVHLMACKLELSGMEHVKRLKEVMKNGWYFLIILALITVFLVIGYQPVLVGVFGCAAILLITFIVSFFQKDRIFNFKIILTGLKGGALQALPISIACATAGIIVGVVGKTGIALQFTNFLLTLSSGYLFFSLFLIAIAAIILGMGLPVTAAYIVLTVLAVPILVNEFQIPLLTANLFVFWLSQTSNVTPPIALAAFAGAGIANARPMQSAIQAFKLAQGFFLIPLMMIYSELIWVENTSIVDYLVSILATIGIIANFAGAIEGRLFTTLNLFERLIALVLAITMLYDHTIIRSVFVILTLLFVIYNYRKNKQTKPYLKPV